MSTEWPRSARLDGPAKLRGQARYSSDLLLPNQLHGAVLRCPHAHARLRALDASAVWRVPGVRAVLTADNVPAMAWYEEGIALFPRRLRFAGEEVAAVAAETEEALDDALRAFRIDYEVLPAVQGLEEAVAALRQVHEACPDNRAGAPDIYERGDPVAGFARAALIVEGCYRTPCALHNALEAHGCNAWWDEDRLHLWASTQGIFALRQGVAEKLGLPLSRVRVEAQHVGGGFGAKQIEWKDSVIAALLAKASGRPVRLLLDREAENLAAGNRNATRQYLRLGADREGRLCAIDVRAEVEVGAYRAGGESSLVTGCYRSLYACENVRCEQVDYYSNLGPAVAFRAPGFVEGTFGLESAMDELARRLDLDPFELRQRNYVDHDQAAGKPYSSPGGLACCLERVKEAFGWSERATGQEARRASVTSTPSTPSTPTASTASTARWRRGSGMAASLWMAGGASPPARALATWHADGGVTVLTGAQDIGTGTRTVLAQIAARALGLPLPRVRLSLGDTGPELPAPTSAGSATLATMGPAVQAAAEQARQRLLKAAAAHLGQAAETLRIEAGYLRGPEGLDLPVEEITRQVPAESLAGWGECLATPEAVAVRTFAAVCADVEVDLDSGAIRVLRLACAPDCGSVVNRKLADSQVIGGVTQGLGFALMESREVDPRSGLVLNANLEDYLIPTLADMPAILHVPVDLPDKAANRLGVKGLGEPPMIAVAPAIANAVCAATGLRLRELPLDRRRLLEALAALSPESALWPGGNDRGQPAEAADTAVPAGKQAAPLASARQGPTPSRQGGAP